MYFVTAKLNLDIPGEYSNYSNSYIKINEIILTFFIHAVKSRMTMLRTPIGIITAIMIAGRSKLFLLLKITSSDFSVVS